MTNTPRRDSNGRFAKATVPGAAGADLKESITVFDIEWTPADAAPLGCPIGVALALELAEAS